MTSELHRKLWDDTDDKLRNAEASLLRLKSEIEKEQRRIDELRKLQSALSPFVDASAVIIPDNSPRTPEAEADTKPVRHADVAQVVLEESENPMHISDIMDAMIAKGHPLPSDPQLRQSAVYSAMLRRPSIFERVGGGRWGLVADAANRPNVPPRNFSNLSMAELAEIAFKAIRGTATSTELAEQLERLGYKHRTNKRATSTSIHKALVRNPVKFRKIATNPGTWELLEIDAQRRPRSGESIENRTLLFPKREGRDSD